MKTIEAHFVCRGERDVYRRDGVFVTGEWSVPLSKAFAVRRVCLHHTKAEPPYLVGDVTRVWMNPRSGRVIFAATLSPEGVGGGQDLSWGRWAAYEETSDVLMTPEREALIRAVVRLGFVVSAADGLDEAETEALVDYAVIRSGLLAEAVEQEAERARGGLGAFSADELALLRSMDSESKDTVLDDIADAAHADGLFSDAEADMLEQVRALIT